MLRNYLKVAWRSLRRRKGFAFINVAGLAVGLACCILIGLYVQDELSYDDFHPRADRIHRVVAEGYAAVGPPVAPALAREYPGLVAAAARFWPIQAPATFRHEDKSFVERQVSFADPSVFEVFSYPMRAGDPDTALEAPFSMVLTQSTAQKYFGDANPLGQSVQMWGRDFEVTGVMEDVPANTHYPVDVLVSLASLPSFLPDGMMQNWPWAGFYTYVLLQEGAEAHELEAALPAFYARHTEEAPAEPRLQAVTDIHLHSHLDKEAAPPGNPGYIYLLMTVAALVLGMACANFTNLSTARSTERIKEVGMRKTVGATRGQIAAQFLGEAVLLSIAALGLAVLLVKGMLPFFNEAAGTSLALPYGDGRLVLALLGLAGGVGLAAGSYPAFFLSRFSPTRILRGRLPSRFAGTGLRRGLVVVQLALSVGLLIGAAVVHQQFGFLQNKNLGFDKERIVVVEAANYEALQEALRQVPAVKAVSAAYGVPGERFQSLPFRTEGMPHDSTHNLRWLGVDYGFIEAMGIEMAAGRSFDRAHGQDGDGALLVNQAAVDALGWTDPVGKDMAALRFSADGTSFEVRKKGRVIGVTKNFNYASLHGPVEPLVMSVASGEDLNLAVLRLRDGAPTQALSQIEAAWKRVNPEDSYFHFFLDDFTDRYYQDEQRLSRVFGVFTALALLIAALGLFGLATLAVRQRTKEIGIRKALGASVVSIGALLSKDFLKLTAAGFALGAPLAYLAASSWLEGFAYRIEPGPLVFVAAGAGALLVTVLAVSTQALRAARANPADALRDE